MSIPRDKFSDFLTKIAHGEKLDIGGHYGTENGGSDMKRRKVSETIDPFHTRNSDPYADLGDQFQGSSGDISGDPGLPGWNQPYSHNTNHTQVSCLLSIHK